MPAYNSNYLTTLPASVNTNTITGAEATSSIPYVEEKELLVAGGELIWAGEGPDVVEQITKSTPLTINLELTSTAPALSGEGTVQVPYVPGTAVDSGTGIGTVDPIVVVPNPVPISNVQAVETYIDAAAGTYVVGHKLTRAWSSALDPNATFVAYESSDGGATMIQRSMNSPPISRFQVASAMRNSDVTYLSIYIEKTLMTANPEVYVTKGTIGGALSSTTYKWTRPYLPVAMTCNGTWFTVVTEGNHIFYTVDGITWADKGVIQPAFPSFPVLLGTQLVGGALYSNTQNVFLQWIPGIARTVLGITVDGMNKLFITDSIYSNTSWVLSGLSSHNGVKLAELAGNIYSVSKIDTSSPSVIYKSTDRGVTWTEAFVGGIINQYSNGNDAVLDSVDVFKGYLVAYTRSPAPRRLKSLDNGATWISEATNLTGATSKTTRLVLANSVVVVTNLGGEGAEYRYSTDGLNFQASAIPTTSLGGTVIQPPAAPTDPYWANVKAMSWNQYPTGNLPSPVPVKDVAGSKVVWSGEQTGAQSVVELPYLGGAVVKAKVLRYDNGTVAWTESLQQYVTTVGTSNSQFLTGQLNYPIGSMPGDFTFEQVVARDTEFEEYWLNLFMDDASSNGIIIRLKKSAGSMLIYSNASMHSVSIGAVLPAHLTYFHVALERYDRVVTLYINGIAVASYTQAINYAVLAGTRSWARYYGQYRLTVGVARYKGPFTPPTALFPTSS